VPCPGIEGEPDQISGSGHISASYHVS
jgi:hypothetical protein